MNFRKSFWLIPILTLAILLSACNIGASAAPAQDTEAIQTQAFNLVMTQAALQQTQTAMAVPPTPLPTNTLLPTATLSSVSGAATVTPFSFNTQQPGLTPITSPVPTSADTCWRLAYISDVTVPDETRFRPGTDFKKIWRVMNTGTCAWDEGYTLVYLGNAMDGYNVKIEHAKDFVKPGETADFGVDLTAPLAENHYEDCWRMRNDSGYFFGSYLCVIINVEK